MSKAWIRAKRYEFVRDVLRDFCLASRELERRFQDYDRTGYIEFEALRDLLGLEMNKGLLWRLKDTAHHIFRNDPGDVLIGKFLDWGMGYIFHETMKLKEDAYQLRYYTPWFNQLDQRKLPEFERSFCTGLIDVLQQTRESINREITRIRFIMSQCRRMLPTYYIRYANNSLLARFIFDKNSLVREVFSEYYDELVDTIYGEQPWMLYLLAAQSLRQGGWTKEATLAIGRARELNPEHPDIVTEEELIRAMVG